MGLSGPAPPLQGGIFVRANFPGHYPGLDYQAPLVRKRSRAGAEALRLEPRVRGWKAVPLGRAGTLPASRQSITD